MTAGMRPSRTSLKGEGNGAARQREGMPDPRSPPTPRQSFGQSRSLRS